METNQLRRTDAAEPDPNPVTFRGADVRRPCPPISTRCANSCHPNRRPAAIFPRWGSCAGRLGGGGGVAHFEPVMRLNTVQRRRPVGPVWSAFSAAQPGDGTGRGRAVSIQ